MTRFVNYLDTLNMATGWLALELNDYGNAARAAQFVAACDSPAGQGRVLPVGWVTRDYTGASARQMVNNAGVRGVILEGEIPAQNLTPDGPVTNPQAPDWNEVVASFYSYTGDKSMATSFTPFQSWHMSGGDWRLIPDRSIAAPLIEAGWYLMPYVYPAENPGSIPSALFYSSHYPGWDDPEPVLGCYGGYELTDFPERNTVAGYSIWDAGQVL